MPSTPSVAGHGRRRSDQAGREQSLLALYRHHRPPVKREDTALARGDAFLYGECMARLISTTIRLEEEDVRALKRARAAGYSASELIRKGLRVVASRYYTGRRPPSTRLFESTDNKLGDESELFKDLEA